MRTIVGGMACIRDRVQAAIQIDTVTNMLRFNCEFNEKNGCTGGRIWLFSSVPVIFGNETPAPSAAYLTSTR